MCKSPLLDGKLKQCASYLVTSEAGTIKHRKSATARRGGGGKHEGESQIGKQEKQKKDAKSGRLRTRPPTKQQQAAALARAAALPDPFATRPTTPPPTAPEVPAEPGLEVPMDGAAGPSGTRGSTPAASRD
ncbi:hypothetical protein PENSPDRAFT_672778, partial [Peniophora sp. CONT]